MTSATLSLQVPDIRCAACALKIEDAVHRLGISRCRTNVASKQVIIEHDPEQHSSESILKHIQELGFEPVANPENFDVDNSKETKKLLTRLGMAGIGAMQVMMFALVTYMAGGGGVEPAYVKLMQWASFALTTPVALYSAVPFYQNAMRDLSHGRVGMDVPVSLAILSAYSLSTVHLFSHGEVYFDSVCMFAFLLLLGRFLELGSRQRYAQNMSLADRCLPDEVTLLNGEVKPLSDVAPGDRVTIQTGGIVPVDGEVVDGEGFVSEAAFTGESRQLRKVSGMNVLAGAQLVSGELTVLCHGTGDETLLAGVSRLYQNAMLYKPEFALLADRVSRYFVAVILLLALVSGLGWYLAGNPDWFVVLITVLVVSCPCALSLATPIAYTVAVTALKQRGVVVRSGSFLEKLANVNHVVLDKTGTLTEGQLTLGQINMLAPDWTQQRVLEVCAALEAGNKHPIAAAFQMPTGLSATDTIYHVGEGVVGCINGVEYRLGSLRGADRALPAGVFVELSKQDEPIAHIELIDDVRASARELCAALSAEMPTTLLSGDRDLEVQRMAGLLGIETARGGQSPEQKVQYVRDLQESGRKVLMVGDGFNDAAAMAAAHTAIAVSPVDILIQQAAEASLLRQDVSRIMELLHFARKLKHIVRQNIVWAVAYNLSVIPLAVMGLLPPWMAALGMSLSSLLVVTNAGRLQKVRSLGGST